MPILLERYGARVKQVRAAVGARPALEDVEQALQQERYKLMTVTHVDTSTGVLTDVRALAALADGTKRADRRGWRVFCGEKNCG
ncbi:MAG: aminotransferase class V-fold PLP-dependent enzyme [Blastocatellia bacterium]